MPLTGRTIVVTRPRAQADSLAQAIAAAGGTPLLYAGSSDWMTRNFFRRVEALFPIYVPALRERVLTEILPSEFKDNVDARVLQPDGTYVPPARKDGEAAFSAQTFFMAAAERRAAAQLEVVT